ncbi:hypothetical protein [Membranihabitans maritimus]|uniref:hypothetical protein n=1 Tax=Membranihabitans maritimus TaxID=2904244 RepID=UPI001F31951A|nr:hypothetical protein [Membranihabitans maritimus]
MKKSLIPIKLILFSVLAVVITSYQAVAQDLDGAWMEKDKDGSLLLVQDGYFSVISFENSPAKFNYTLGGVVDFDGSVISVKIEFHSMDKTEVGNSHTFSGKLKGKELVVDRPEGYQQTWIKVDEEEQGLAGVWRITGRKSDGKINQMPKRARKTLKLLTDNHFQWIAMNTDTGEFFGTGGGKYTFEDGKYTEHIKFFSRDDSRVGMSLSFDGEVKDEDWHHSGKSSKGDPIYEIWSSEEY